MTQEKHDIRITALILLSLMIFAILLSMGFRFFDTARDKPIKTVVDGFFISLVQKDYNMALEYCTGEQAYIVKTNLVESDISDAALTKIQYDPISLNQNLAEVAVTVEVVAGAKSHAQRYLIHLMKKETDWKIYSVEKINMAMPGDKNRPNDQEIEDVYLGYLSELSNNNWIKAGDFLTGEALNGHSQMTEIVKEEAIFKTFTKPVMQFLAGNNETCVYNFKYKVDDRYTDVLVTFYHTQHGWKIIKINQV
ncbi:MAG: hypothetical protein GX295_11680 [Syntrophomonadaceae bacterium]|nr:hypothetical protein [Syntrophomonadaceae bacterium]